MSSEPTTTVNDLPPKYVWGASTPLVQLRLPDAMLVLAKLCDYAAGHAGPCEVNDAIAAVEEAIRIRTEPIVAVASDGAVSVYREGPDHA